MKIGIACDHGAFELKENLKKELEKEYEIIDCGNTVYDKMDDYPEYAFRLAEKVATKELDYGIALCTSGIGIAIACNKVKGAYCALVHNMDDVLATRHHNNTNIITFSGGLTANEAIEMVKTFVTTEFSNEERHIRRNNMIIKYENGEYNEL